MYGFGLSNLLTSKIYYDDPAMYNLSVCTHPLAVLDFTCKVFKTHLCVMQVVHNTQLSCRASEKHIVVMQGANTFLNIAMHGVKTHFQNCHAWRQNT